MVKNSIVFYVFLLLFLTITLLLPFNYGLLVWYITVLTGNSIIIQKAMTKKPPQKKALIIISSIFIALPVLYLFFILAVAGGITC
ncbi:MAG: hypothetical protein QM710_04360 [Flavobacterium sp.]